jgi:hypothetical protein
MISLESSVGQLCRMTVWCEHAQVNSRDVRPIEDELRGRRFFTHVDHRLLNRLVCRSLAFFGSIVVLHVTFRNLLQTISVISMIRVGGVKERELRVLTLVLADPVLEMGGVGRFDNEGRCPVNNGCVHTR